MSSQRKSNALEGLIQSLQRDLKKAEKREKKAKRAAKAAAKAAKAQTLESLIKGTFGKAHVKVSVEDFKAMAILVAGELCSREGLEA